MKIVVASVSPVKNEAVKRGFALLFPEGEFVFESVKANSGVSDQPMSSDEMRNGALGRIAHARSLAPEADFYIGLEGGAEELYGELYNYGWVVVESKEGKRGFGRTFSFALPSAIRERMVNEGLEQSHASDQVFSKSDTKVGTGTIGPLTNDRVTYTDWYVHGVVGALVPFVRAEHYPYIKAS